MRLETVVVITKGWCLMTGAMAAGLVSEMNTPVIIFWGITDKNLIGAYAVGCSALVAFLSSSFGNYLQSRETGATVKP